MTSLHERRSVGVLPSDAHPILRRIHEYWVSIRPEEGLLPGRQHMDPVDLRDVLNNIWLVDVVRAPLRFRWRLLGAIHAEAMRGNHVGRWVDEVIPDFASKPHYQSYLLAAEEGAFVYRAGPPMVRTDRDFMWVETIILPFAGDGRTVDMIMGAVVIIKGAQAQ